MQNLNEIIQHALTIEVTGIFFNSAYSNRYIFSLL